MRPTPSAQLTHPHCRLFSPLTSSLLLTAATGHSGQRTGPPGTTFHLEESQGHVRRGCLPCAHSQRPWPLSHVGHISASCQGSRQHTQGIHQGGRAVNLGIRERAVLAPHGPKEYLPRLIRDLSKSLAELLSLSSSSSGPSQRALIRPARLVAWHAKPRG